MRPDARGALRCDTAGVALHPCAGETSAEEKTMSHTIPTNLAKVLPRGVALEHCTITTWAELSAKHDVTVKVAERPIRPAEPSAERRRRGVSALKLRRILGPLTVVVLPGYYATDGNAEVEYRTAKSAKEAAREYVESGDWGERDRTIWIDVLAYRKALGVRKDDVVEIRIDEQRHTIPLDPEEPPCTRDEHTWGERDMRGHGGGVIITDICMHCARYRIIDTW